MGSVDGVKIKRVLMNKSITILIIIATAFIVFWLTFLKMITPGYVGVVVNYFGDDKGVDHRVLTTGMHWVAPWKTVYEFPVFEQNINWEGDHGFGFQTKEGMAVHGDVGITFHLIPDYVPAIFQRYRRGMDEISHLFVRNYIRDAINTAASKMAIEDLYGSGKEEFFRNVQSSASRELDSLGICINRIYLIGRFGFPQGVITALNAKIEATQRAQQRENELREAEAEAKKQIAKAEGHAKCSLLQAEAEAKANMVLSQSITPELIQWQYMQKWDGVMPKVMGTNASVLMPIDTMIAR